MAFAAPLVIVLGCRRPIAEPLDEPAFVPHESASVVADAPSVTTVTPDAAPDVASDAAIADEQHDAGVVVVETPRRRFSGCGPNHDSTCNPPHLTVEYCDTHPDERRCPKPSAEHCREHPTAARCPCASPTICNPPGNLVGRIVNISVVADGTQIVVGIGSDRGVTKDMTARIVGGALATLELTLIQIQPRMSRWLVRATPDQIKASSGTVSFTPK